MKTRSVAGLLGAALLISLTAFSQKPTEKWYWAGSPAPAVDFTPATPTALFNNGMTFCHESGTSLADANGNLLFYADGNAIVFNQNHVAMTNGTALVMHNSVAQGCIFIPKPGSTNIYYLFHIGVPGLGSPPFHLYYSEIDMNLSAGLGSVTAAKNVSIATSFGNTAEKMTATRHCNGTDIWLVVHSYSGNTYRAYLVTAAGINTTPVVSSVGTSLNAVNADWMGQMKISPSGTKIATTVYDQGIVDVCDFNGATGVVSNPLILGSIGQGVYGVEFSPDNTKLYASATYTPAQLVQWDLCAGSNAAIVSSQTTAANASVYSMQMANNGKVYCANATGFLGAINNPNVAGTGCNYVNNSVNVAPGNSWLGLPNFLTSYFDLPANKPQATVVPVNSGSCGCTGSATASICSVFGAAPYTYSWSNGTTTGPTTGLSSTISNLCPGTYSVVVNDASCRADTATFTISPSGNSFTVTPTSTPATCGAGNGSASVSVTGGTPNYTYQWNPGGQSTSAVSGLAAGNYTVTITDGAACTSSSVITISATSSTSVAITSQNVICNGGNNGTAGAAMSGGTAPYTYSWSNSQTTQLISGLAPGNYSCTVTDVSGCSSTQTVSITEPPVMTSNAFVSTTNCGQSTGMATAVVNGGVAPYSYLWTNGQTSSTATGLGAGSYSCTVTDAGGCTSVVLATIVAANGPIGTISSQTQPSCFGGSNGTASAAVTSGGTPPYTFVWSNGQTSQNATGLSAGTYSVNTIDAGGCSFIQTVTITQPTAIASGINSTTASCNLSDGTATVSASGGTSPFTYAWIPVGGTGPAATGLSAGNYSVIITDANGCSIISTTTVANGSGPNATIGSSVTIQAGSSVTLNAGGGVNYLWSPSSGLSDPTIASPVAAPAETTTYCVLVSDSGGCMDSACVTVYVIPEPVPCGEFYLPNAFSPNDDNENDVFKAYILPSCVLEFKLVIYNRWGEKVFETETVTNGWDGNFRGVPSDPAVYAYVCRASLTNGKKFVREGNISLIR